MRTVVCRHPTCGAETRVRLPASVPVGAIHRVVCSSCRQTFDPPPPAAGGAGPLEPLRDGLLAAWDRILDARDAAGERLGAGERPKISRARLWTWASVPIAALGVVAGLALLQGDDGTPPPSSSVTISAAPKGARGEQAKFIEGPGYSLALPAGWEQSDPPDGAAFAAGSEDGLADATLWIEEDPELSFREFEQRSLAQLEEIGDDPRIVDRVQGPTIESTITELRADAPVADGVEAPIRVTLRAAGDYRLYLSTVVQPGAAPETGGDVETLHASLRPDVTLAGTEDGG